MANLSRPSGVPGLGDHAGQSELRTAKAWRIYGIVAWLVLLGARAACSHVFEVRKAPHGETAGQGILEEGAV